MNPHVVVLEFHDGPLDGCTLEGPDDLSTPTTLTWRSRDESYIDHQTGFVYRLEDKSRERGYLIAAYWPAATERP